MCLNPELRGRWCIRFGWPRSDCHNSQWWCVLDQPDWNERCDVRRPFGNILRLCPIEKMHSEVKGEQNIIGVWLRAYGWGNAHLESERPNDGSLRDHLLAGSGCMQNWPYGRRHFRF